MPNSTVEGESPRWRESHGDTIPNSTVEEFRVAERDAREQGRGLWGR